ncbi:MAG: PQQ-binding-like beta-propeller repeat protein [Pirellulaceae bacterium]|nr:PQQ-binding-like beta-propeller repeat protein [Pirellulaceae bacterium]
MLRLVSMLVRPFIVAILLAFVVGYAGAQEASKEAVSQTPLRIVVMDPLAKQLACDCVAGYAQRDYGKLAAFLEAELQRPVQLAYGEALASPQIGGVETVDLIIGKFSVVAFDARRIGLAVCPVAMLSGKDGSIMQNGLFVVRQNDPAQSIEDLAGYRLLFGPEDSDEKRSAAFATLEAFDVPLPEEIQSKASCSTAALAVAENDTDACVVSSYAMRLLEGCGTVKKGELRIVGVTDPVPFIGVFATGRVDREEEQRLCRALLEIKQNGELLTAMESKHGLVRLPAITSTAWNDWRGPGRHALSNEVPNDLPPKKQLLWSRTLTGPGMAGLAVADGYVVVADKNLDETHDIFRCLDADTGRQVWKITYPAAGHMDFTNSPRATPVIHDGLVYLLGAFGELYCVEMETGQVVWKRHLARDFAAERPTWGYCSAPLIVGDKLVVNPGAKDASLVALDRRTGESQWITAGRAPGYACFVSAKLGGVRQIVGYDATTLGGWDPDTGERLWELLPELDGDYNVPTPIVVDEKILVTTENNGTRLYGFDADGRIQPKPLAVNEDLAPDTATPVVLDGMVLANIGGLMCLDVEDGLKTLWEVEDDDLCEYCTFIAGNGHVLVTTQTGKLYLVKADKQRFDCVAKLDLFNDVPLEDRDVWSHPALVGNRIYVRNMLAVYCFLLEPR